MAGIGYWLINSYLAMLIFGEFCAILIIGEFWVKLQFNAQLKKIPFFLIDVFFHVDSKYQIGFWRATVAIIYTLKIKKKPPLQCYSTVARPRMMILFGQKRTADQKTNFKKH